MLRTAIRVLDRVFTRIVAAFCLLLFLICLYSTVDAANVYLNANDTSVLKYKPKAGEAPAVLRELSEDAVGWLVIDGTGVDFPVMQGTNNYTYVNTDPYGNFSLSGSIFLDCRNHPDFADPYSMVYGHHMEYGAMFGALDAFYSGDYLRSHQTGTLMTHTGGDYHLTVFACCRTLATEDLIFSPVEADPAELVQYLQRNAGVYDWSVDPTQGPILALSTCQGANTLDRLVVFCVLNRAEAETPEETGLGVTRNR